MTARILALALCVVVVASGCGKKGAPLPPLLRVPAKVGGFSAHRSGERVYLTLTVPAANVGGDQPADVAVVEVYAATSAAPPELTKGSVSPALTLVASAPVRRPVPPPPPVTPRAGQSGPAVPPLPIEPGLDQGAVVTLVEVLSESAMAPSAAAPSPLPAPGVPETMAGDARPALSLPLAFVPGAGRIRRHYVAVAASRQGRRGEWSDWQSIPVPDAPRSSAAPAVTYDERSVTLTWTPPPGAVLPPAAPADGGLESRPLGPAAAPTRYNVYAAAVDVVPSTVPGAVQRPAPLNAAPLAEPTFTMPDVAFDAERCFTVRGLDTVGGVDVEGAASASGCVTARDTFAPAAPASLEAVGGVGVVSLIWDAVTAPDLAGYLVYRGPAPGEPTTLLTAEPLGATSFEDRTVTPGTRYVYAVVAVDSAQPANRSAPSNRAEETARR